MDEHRAPWARGLARPCSGGGGNETGAWAVLTRAVQFILSYFPRTSGKQTMHHPKDGSMKQLGCVKLFLLQCEALPWQRQTLMHNSREWRTNPSCKTGLELTPGKYILKVF